MHLPSVRYQDLFRYRSVWMGIAILWVACFHTSINWPWFLDWKVAGYGGVDIFFFASGLGCYYSLQRDPDPAHFLAKRLKRILPAYYPVLFLWLALQLFVFRSGINLLEILSNLLCTGTFCGADHQFNWYVSGVWLSYLLAPFLFFFVNNFSSRSRLLLVPFLFLLSLPFLPSEWGLISLMDRLPVFSLGFLFGKKAQEQPNIQSHSIIVWFVLSVIGAFLWWFSYHYMVPALTQFGLWWYPLFPYYPRPLPGHFAAVHAGAACDPLAHHPAGRTGQRLF